MAVRKAPGIKHSDMLVTEVNVCIPFSLKNLPRVSFQIPEHHFRVMCYYLDRQDLIEKPAHSLAVGKWQKDRFICH